MEVERKREQQNGKKTKENRFRYFVIFQWRTQGMHQVIDLCYRRYVNIILLLICVVRYWIVIVALNREIIYEFRKHNNFEGKGLEDNIYYYH